MVRAFIGAMALWTLLASSAATARDLGEVSETDAWVRTYNYSQEEVYVLKGYYGFVTVIFFRSDEEIVTISAGDAQAWNITVAGNKDFIFLKPTMEPAAPTNLTVITDRRVYLFDLRTEEAAPGETPADLTLKVFFTYPEPAGPNRVEERRMAEEREREEQLAREAAERRADREAELEALRLQREIQEDARRQEEAAMLRERDRLQIEREAETRRLAEEAAQAAAAAERQRVRDRLNAPSVIFDDTENEGDAGRPTDEVQSLAPPLGTDAYVERLEGVRTDDYVFLQDAAAQAAATLRGGATTAVQIQRLDQKVLQGSLIMGTLETAIDSSLTGMIRATVAEPVWSADASQILVPRGSRLIGTYQSNVQFGATRVLVAWTRVIRPDGVSVELGSGGADGLGRAGIPGIADTHFTTRFGAAALVSIIAGGSALAVGQLDESATQETGGDIAGTANENFAALLDPYLNIPTTIHVHQGARVLVYVARDLSFLIETI